MKSYGAELIKKERQRQIKEKGWTAKYDDQHQKGELALAGALYARATTKFPTNIKALWPWDMKCWKPTPEDPIRQLTKAGALIAAEIDRLSRAELIKQNEMEELVEIDEDGNVVKKSSS